MSQAAEKSTSKPRSELVKRAAVARFFSQEPEEVDRQIREDGLPHCEVPGPQRNSVRIFLPDLHQWLLKRSQLSPRLGDFREFRRAFFEAQPEREPRRDARRQTREAV